MGSNNAKIQSSPDRSKKKIEKNRDKRQIVESKKEQEKRISELFIAAERNATLVLEQLKENDDLSLSVVNSGGVAFTTTLDGEIDRIHETDINKLPPKLLDKLQSRVRHDYDIDERNIIADIMKTEDSKVHGMTAFSYKIHSVEC